MFMYFVVSNRSGESKTAIGSMEVTEKETIIGRGDEGLQLNSRSCSRRHAAISVKNGQVVLRDLESRNGVFLNGKKVKQAILEAGNLLHIGSFDIRILNIAQSGRVSSQVQPKTDLAAFNTWPENFRCLPKSSQQVFKKY